MNYKFIFRPICWLKEWQGYATLLTPISGVGHIFVDDRVEVIGDKRWEICVCERCGKEDWAWTGIRIFKIK